MFSNNEITIKEFKNRLIVELNELVKTKGITNITVADVSNIYKNLLDNAKQYGFNIQGIKLTGVDLLKIFNKLRK